MAETQKQVAANQIAAAVASGLPVHPDLIIQTTTVGDIIGGGGIIGPTAPVDVEFEADALKRVLKLKHEHTSKDFKDESGQRLLRAVYKVREAFASWQTTTWDLANALLDVEDAYREHWAKRPSQMEIARLIGVNLSKARIGQLLNTARYFRGVEVDRAVDFRRFEDARKADERAEADGTRRVSKERLAQAAKEGTDVFALLKIDKDAPAKRNPPNDFVLRVYLRSDPKSSLVPPKPSWSMRFRGREEIPENRSELLNAINRARQALDELERSCEATQPATPAPADPEPFV